MNDAISLQGAQFMRSPDVSSWPITTTITRLRFDGSTPIVAFNKSDLWPMVTPEGWGGGIQFTVWMVRTRNGQVFAAGGIEFWKDRQLEPAAFGAEEMPANWFYDASWGPLGTPFEPGEIVGFMVVAGDQRAKDVRSVLERSAVVAVPWNGTATRYDATATPGPTPTPTPDPVPGPAPDVTLADVFAQLGRIEAATTALAAAVAAVGRQLSETAASVLAGQSAIGQMIDALPHELPGAPPAYQGTVSVFGVNFKITLTQVK